MAINRQEQRLFRESGGAGSRGLTLRRRLEAEGEESLDAVVAADGIGNHESELEQEVGMVAIAAPSPDQRLPVVVEGLDATGGWPVFAQRQDRGAVCLLSLIHI